MNITLGQSIGGDIRINLDVLMKTRLLIQANSGGGKSWLLRRMAEQLFGKIPVFIIDPEGEFATLREKFGYVLVGKGGEAPADSRCAALVAHKLLELRASAVFDLYELKPHERHHWVKLFLDGLMNAPKNLWLPTIVIVDEAHGFCPEGKAGESEASGSVVDLATRGRKRQFCAVLATQRLGKLRKDASAELLNRLVGPTFEDVDLDRAADLLSVPSRERNDFFAQMRVLEPGNFFGLGRAICVERKLLKVGSVETSHEFASAKFGSEPPPAPEKVRLLLPKLADLPKAAEEKARTEAELRSEIRSLKTQLAQRPEVKSEIKEVSVVKPEHLMAVRDAAKLFEKIHSEIEVAFASKMDEIRNVYRELNGIYGKLSIPRTIPQTHIRPPMQRQPIIPKTQPAAKETTNGEVKLDKCARAILAVLARHEEGCTIGKLAMLSGYRKSGGFRNNLTTLRNAGYLEGANTGIMKITEAGLSTEDFERLPQTGEELQRYWLNFPYFDKCARLVLQVLIDNPEGLDIASLASACNYEVSGGFKNNLTALRTAGVLIGKNNEVMKPTEEFFL